MGLARSTAAVTVVCFTVIFATVRAQLGAGTTSSSGGSALGSRAVRLIHSGTPGYGENLVSGM